MSSSTTVSPCECLSRCVAPEVVTPPPGAAHRGALQLIDRVESQHNTYSDISLTERILAKHHNDNDETRLQ